MMNLLQVQDDLKNFSQDQLVKEMQQPSGSTPQFLVLSELNRRKRVKGDFEARQAKQQPTVAEEAVASAGVPQEGMMGMSEAMAPASMESGGIGSMMPKTMKMGGEVDRYSNGGLIEGIADSVSQNAEALQGIQEATMQNSKLLQDQQNTPIAQPQPAVPRPMPTPMPIRPFQPPRYFSGPARISDMRNRFDVSNGMDQLNFNPASRIPPSFGGKGMPRAIPYAEGGVIRAQDGLPNYRGFGKLGSDTRGDSFRRPYDPTITDDFEQTGNVDVGGLFGFGQPEPRSLMEIAQTGPQTMEELEILEKSEIDAEKASPLVIEPEPKEPEKKPEQKLNLTSKDAPLTIEEELLKRQADLSKSKDFDKYMALAQAGLAIMSSDKPTLAGAIGEGGTAGLTAFNEARKRYDEGLTDILNARSKLQQARISAGSKGKLTRSGALTAISSYNNAITAIRKEIADIYQKNPAADQDASVMAQINDLKNQIIGLETEKSQLYDTAQIRPRASILVKDLPSSQKEA
tara:strand:+ start:1439 stop:2986 length:1548 start_codon:yes stop_codon:yes gene_type:complete